jgi:hypothetical protein
LTRSLDQQPVLPVVVVRGSCQSFCNRFFGQFSDDQLVDRRIERRLCEMNDGNGQSDVRCEDRRLRWRIYTEKLIGDLA